MNEEQLQKLEIAESIIGYKFDEPQFLLSAITHPSAVEGRSVRYSYERLEFLGDSILGAIVSVHAFDSYHDLDEGGLTRIKVALVSGAHLSEVAESLGLANAIIFGSSERGTGKRGLHSALENVYEAIVAALFLDGGIDAANNFVERTLIDRMSRELAREPENPKSALQEKLQEGGITPTYKLVDTQGPPHDRTFVAQVFAGERALGQGSGRTKKEAESRAAKSTLAQFGEFFGLGLSSDEMMERAIAQQQARVDKVAAQAQAKVNKAAKKAASQKEKETAKAASKHQKNQKKQQKRKRKEQNSQQNIGRDIKQSSQQSPQQDSAQNASQNDRTTKQG